MTSASAGLALLERAVGFALGCADAVAPGALAYPTPCAEWDLGALLAHAGDSAAVLREAIGSGRVPGEGPARGAQDAPAGRGLAARGAESPEDIDPARRADPAAAFRAQARLLLGACADGGPRRVAIGALDLAAGLVAATGAIELAVHGWDISAACGQGRPIPPPLARELLDVAVLVVNGATRPGLFGAPVPVAPFACPGDRLVAMLGRTPPGGPSPPMPAI